MLYKERQPHIIAAWQFLGKDTLADSLLENICIEMYAGPQKKTICPQCNRRMEEHAVLNGGLLCPQSYIIHEGNTIVSIMTKTQFESVYKPIGEIVEMEENENEQN